LETDWDAKGGAMDDWIVTTLLIATAATNLGLLIYAFSGRREPVSK
jgi:hypothetical protein